MSQSSSSPSVFLAGMALGTTCSLAFGYWFFTPTTVSGRRNRNQKASSVPAELREEQLSRHALYFGGVGMQSIRNARVCVVGLGGVGSHTAVMLARGGVEHLRLIDFDQVTLSSLNRHACATLDDVGIPKVTCVKEWCRKLGVVDTVDARVEMYTAKTGPTLLGEGVDEWDMVIDCIDDVPTKAALLAYCIQRKIRVLSCMGAGGKSDMTRLHISDLRTAAKDPLASKLRQTLKRTMKKQMASGHENQGQSPSQSGDVHDNKAAAADSYLDDMDQLTIIYSSEKTVAKLAEFTAEQQQQGDKSQFGAVDGMRVRILPVLGPMPAIMGQSLASMTLCELGRKPIHQPVTGERLGRTVRHRKFQHLKRREELINKGTIETPDNAYKGHVEIDIDDVEYVMGVWRNCCAVTGARLGTVLELVRWDITKPARTDNLVVMSGHALEAYDSKGKASIPEDAQQRIETRLAACRDQNGELY